MPEVTFMNALHVGAPVTEIHKRPCVRDALMTGMAAGFALGGVRFIFRGEDDDVEIMGHETDRLYSTGLQSV